MPRLIDETGNRYGRLAVTGRARSISYGSGFPRIRWSCECDCGRVLAVLGESLRSGNTKSCGCLKNDMTGARSKIHGLSSSRRYKMWANAKATAKRRGVPFSLTPDDVPEASERCPVLGIPLIDSDERSPGSPSLDRVIPSNGYVSENVRVISDRANRMKQDATTDETLSIAAYQMGCPDSLMGWADYKQVL